MLEEIKKHLARIIIGLIVVLVFLVHAVELWGLRLPLIGNLEAIVYDTRLQLTMPGGVDPRIVILDIDENSLAEREKGGEGRWPWPRDRLALLLDKLFDKYEIAVLGFDVVFAERDESSSTRMPEDSSRSSAWAHVSCATFPNSSPCSSKSSPTLNTTTSSQTR